VPRARNSENRGYPKSWRFRYDAYYYRVPKGQEHLWDGKKEFHLGRSLSEASAEWAKRLHRIENNATVDALLARYKLDVIPFLLHTIRAIFTDVLMLAEKALDTHVRIA
jgi:hypothetical protein